MIAKPGNKTAAPSWPDPDVLYWQKLVQAVSLKIYYAVIHVGYVNHVSESHNNIDGITKHRFNASLYRYMKIAYIDNGNHYIIWKHSEWIWPFEYDNCRE